MKKLVAALLLGAFLFITGCGYETNTAATTETVYDLNSNYEENKTVETVNEVETEKVFELNDDGIKLKLSGNVQYVPIGKESVYLNYKYLYMYTFVDLETGIMYLYTENESDGLEERGLGTTWNMLTNSDGTPRICDKLNALREFYEYEVE